MGWGVGLGGWCQGLQLGAPMFVTVVAGTRAGVRKVEGALLHLHSRSICYTIPLDQFLNNSEAQQ